VEKNSMDITIAIDNKKIKVDKNVVSLISSYRQHNFDDCEAGGILIGRESIDTGNIIIEYATQPFDSDKRTRTLFHRIDKKHIEYYNDLYEKNNGIYAYIGEWHTHAEDYPNYSFLDIKNWKRISNMNKDKQKKYFHIIVGIKEIRVWEYRYNSRKAIRVY
jgi:integrative and conjugative element protein (TIGR02256 family)